MSVTTPRSLTRLVVLLLATLTLVLPATAGAQALPPNSVLLPLILKPPLPPAEVIVDNCKTFVPYEGSTYLYVVGEVKNNTTSKVRFVKITATARDAEGNVEGTNYAYALVGVIEPGGLSPFRVIISGVTNWSTCDLTVTWSPTTASWWPLAVSNVQSDFTAADGFHVTGTVRNQYTVARTGIEVIVAMYDANDEVIGVGWWFTSPSSMAPGAEANFEVTVGFWVGQPNHAAVARVAVIAGAD